MRLVTLPTTWFMLVGMFANLSIHAFVVPSRSLVFHQQQHQPQQQQCYQLPYTTSFSYPFHVRTTTINIKSSITSLNMGLVEDFVSSSDQKTRQVANDKYLQELQQRVDKINAWETTIEELEDDELQAKTKAFQQRLVQGKEDINGPLLEEAFAVVREAAW
jgi:hypothetical protein